MRHRLKGTELSISRIGLGTSNFGKRTGPAASRAIMAAAVDHGVNLIDTADMYGSAALAEEVIAPFLVGRRDRVVLATKFGFNRTGDEIQSGRGARSLINLSIEASLRRLRTDHIDLYQMHYPDPGTPIDETLETLTALQRQGKIRHFGCANFAPAELREANERATALGTPHFRSVQTELSLLSRSAERDLLPICASLDITVVAYFVLARGLLTGKYVRGAAVPATWRLSGRRGQVLLTDANFDVVEALTAFASERGVPIAALAIGSALAMPAVGSALVGATSVRQLEELVAASTWTPARSDLDALDGLMNSAPHAATALNPITPQP
ncbi:aldo/keto reductase [Phytomonospora sp. NPDC050363]|uniref:aldo/keto reductase n=1 Tax=Phytomonospora sp. NPDC050363 TaxID=3155642 RepID=UPI0033CB3315